MFVCKLPTKRLLVSYNYLVAMYLTKQLHFQFPILV